MATGMPQAFFPQPQVPPRPFGPAPVADPDRDASLWLGIYVVGGGVVATLGLVAAAAWSNAREHDAIRERVGEADGDLQVYKKQHAESHAILAAEQDKLFAHLQAQVNALYPDTRRVLSAPPSPATVYAEPAFEAPVAYSIRPSRDSYVPSFANMPLPSFAWAPSSYPPSTHFAPTLPSAGVGPMAALTQSLEAHARASERPTRTLDAPTRVLRPSFSSAPTAAPSSGMARTIPKHLEAAVTRAMSR